MKEVIKNENKERNLNARERLLFLEKEGKFLFHGSPDKIEVLEPRQPLIYNIHNKKKEKHGNLCVAATPCADIAIFRAIVNSKNFSKDDYASSFGVNKDDTIKLATTKPVLEKIKDKKGFVHVISRELFDKFSDMEWRSEKTIKPEEIVSVTAEDLPPNIQLIDKDFNPIKIKKNEKHVSFNNY